MTYDSLLSMCIYRPLLCIISYILHMYIYLFDCFCCPKVYGCISLNLCIHMIYAILSSWFVHVWPFIVLSLCYSSFHTMIFFHWAFISIWILLWTSLNCLISLASFKHRYWTSSICLLTHRRRYQYISLNFNSDLLSFYTEEIKMILLPKSKNGRMIYFSFKKMCQWKEEYSFRKNIISCFYFQN